ncbi:hypothetical protein IMSAG049_01557 [Clostridiales bacterium]|nr:hypothetical protein IMSAG049_01557 [Clostridiales bacterium]
MHNFGKRFVVGMFSVLMSVSAYANEAVDLNSEIYVNGNKIINASAKSCEGYTMVPVRFIAEKLGCKVIWNDTLKKVSIKDDSNSSVNFTVGVNTMVVGDEIRTIPVAAVIVDDMVYVPLRSLSDGLDIDITWNEMTRTISVYSASAERAVYNNSYSEAPKAVLDKIYMKPGEDIVLPINCDPNLKMKVDVSDEKNDICTVRRGYMNGSKALFIHAESRGTAGITIYYEGFDTMTYDKTTINVHVVDRKEKALITFDDMLRDQEIYYKDIFREIEEHKMVIEKNNGLYVFDRNDIEYEKLFVGDDGMLIIPVDFGSNASGVFDISYDKSSAVSCIWGEYEGKHCIMITADSYALVPIRITFTENSSGNVSFTVTDRDMSILETPVVYSYGDNEITSTWWDIIIRSVAEGSQELKNKNSLLKDRTIYIK